MTNKIEITKKESYNALSNAKHIFTIKEDDITFKIVEVFNEPDSCKAICVNKETGEVFGLYTNSSTAKASLNDVLNVFGDDQPYIKIIMVETKKGNNVYKVEIV